MRIGDWSSDVCSSDLSHCVMQVFHLDAASIQTERDVGAVPSIPSVRPADDRDRKSVVSGKSVSVRVDLGGRRIMNKKHRKENRHRTLSISNNDYVGHART